MKEANSVVIVKGISVSPGLVTGSVKIVKNSTDINKIKSGDIMVVRNSSPAFAVGVMNSSGLICEGGGMLTHVCIVSMEMGIPCIADAERATKLLEENMIITLDATKGIIYGSGDRKKGD
ncbi:PEP-utilizing enzyme, mobile region domain protein [Candidatus Thiomargarita nelsonii]|uniref:PEP-utilizing enzyme, mobile region domain protein n=1 Tax=Candidatus Thiomargarita nelsonii TaxID=1003181 RepID=A0A0A6P2V9_9GAMM|nr:PEP-utilizing enzyme, mobile region domain protein [Candidatus Thiomargarita nelsonii]